MCLLQQSVCHGSAGVSVAYSVKPRHGRMLVVKLVYRPEWHTGTGLHIVEGETLGWLGFTVCSVCVISARSGRAVARCTLRTVAGSVVHCCGLSVIPCKEM